MKVISVGFKGQPQQKGSAAAGEGKKESLLHTGGSEKTNWPKEQELGNPNYSCVVLIPGRDNARATALVSCLGPSLLKERHSFKERHSLRPSRFL
jgi:hypothetical protein